MNIQELVYTNSTWYMNRILLAIIECTSVSSQLSLHSACVVQVH